jgi:hypothetical protein
MLTKKQPSTKSETPSNSKTNNNSNTKSASPALQEKHDLTTTSTQKSSSNAGKNVKTRITVKYDVGFQNNLFIRGKGANLSWDKGMQMKNLKNDEWIWETDAAFPNGEFKVLINDRTYETGHNHPLNCGATIQYTPHF